MHDPHVEWKSLSPAVPLGARLVCDSAEEYVDCFTTTLVSLCTQVPLSGVVSVLLV